jgi:DNA-binding MarR family transcriptional regulator
MDFPDDTGHQLPFPHRTGYWVNRLAGEIRTRVDRRLKEHELTRSQLSIVMPLHVGRASTAAELTRELRVDSTAVTRLVDRLEAKGWLQRVADPEDRRVQRLELTAQARARIPEMQAVGDELEAGFLAGVDSADLAVFHRVLMQMLANVGEDVFAMIAEDEDDA